MESGLSSTRGLCALRAGSLIRGRPANSSAPVGYRVAVGDPNYGRCMTRYVALLRGINVGGINIKMVDLARVFTELGFERVKTVLASGNVLFDSTSADVPALKKTIERSRTRSRSSRSTAAPSGR